MDAGGQKDRNPLQLQYMDHYQALVNATINLRFRIKDGNTLRVPEPLLDSEEGLLSMDRTI
jgi:hypothetical protein